MFIDILAENIEYEVADKFSGSANGTSYQSEITTTYDRLETLFGTPTYTDADPYERSHVSGSLMVKFIIPMSMAKRIGNILQPQYTLGSMEEFLQKNVHGILAVSHMMQ